MPTYKPEGMLIDTVPNRQAFKSMTALMEAQASGRILVLPRERRATSQSYPVSISPSAIVSRALSAAAKALLFHSFRGALFSRNVRIPTYQSLCRAMS